MFGFLKKTSSDPARDKPALMLHNTLSNQSEVFSPLNHTVRMYNCGPTPYDEQHIGNMFGQVHFNVLRRALEVWGYPVAQVTNITDFGHLSGDNEGNADIGEDRMTKGLAREGLAFTMQNMRKLAEKYTEIFLRDIEHLCIPVKKIRYPRASDYIPQMIALIQTLEEKSYAYKTSDGVYFNTAKFPTYGKLGGINLNALQEGARVEVNAEKQNPHDFALWKFAEGKNKLGWPSPWGKGFPGWHIECTAMIFTLLGKQIDIHTGGVEHIPIHHNNELAQAEAATGKQFSRYWLHNAHITIEGKKISKSLGNTVYLHNIEDKGYDPRALRYWFLTGHYRTPMNFTWDALQGANTTLKRLERTYLEAPKGPVQEEFLKEFYAAVADDLSTARALALVWENIHTLSQATFKKVDAILGLQFAANRPIHRLQLNKNELPGEVAAWAREREEARTSKDFALSDELRLRIEEAGFDVSDTPLGQKITKK